MGTWRMRATWLGKTLLYAFALYFLLLLIGGALVFGPGGGSPVAGTVFAIASAAVALSASVAVNVRWPDLDLRALHHRSIDWEIAHPVRWIAISAVTYGVLFPGLTRTVWSVFVGIPSGAVFGWYSRRRLMRRRAQRRERPPTGWYDDPSGRHQSRWWDGDQWTATVFDDGAQSTDPPGAPA